jgi:aspartyl/asparaginyl beta-hydroxylase (cupin superfamily)
MQPNTDRQHENGGATPRMSWNEKVNARGRKLPIVGKSLFQIGKELRPKIDALIMRHSLVPDQAIIDKVFFPWISRLEQHWQVISEEAVAIRAQDIPSLGDISFDHGRIAADRRWRSFFIKGYGYRINSNCARAPRTAALIEQVPGLVTACFSVLEAGGHIPRHWGMTKGMLTYHLALKTPQGRERCRMNLEGPEQLHVLAWEEGQSFVFDDMYNHEVWNETQEDRYLLLIQVKRPCRWRVNLIQNLFLFGVRYSRFVQDIVKNLDGLEGSVRQRSELRPPATP